MSSCLNSKQSDINYILPTEFLLPGVQQVSNLATEFFESLIFPRKSSQSQVPCPKIQVLMILMKKFKELHSSSCSV